METAFGECGGEAQKNVLKAKHAVDFGNMVFLWLLFHLQNSIIYTKPLRAGQAWNDMDGMPGPLKGRCKNRNHQSKIKGKMCYEQKGSVLRG